VPACKHFSRRSNASRDRDGKAPYALGAIAHRDSHPLPWPWNADSESQHVGLIIQSAAPWNDGAATQARQKPSSFSIDDALEKARQNEKQMATAYGGGVKQGRHQIRWSERTPIGGRMRDKGL
jgi:hypothetical protein